MAAAAGHDAALAETPAGLSLDVTTRG